MFCIVSPLGCFALYENVSITTYIAGIFHRGKVLSLLPKFYFYWELIYSHDGVYHGFHTLPTILLLCVDSGPCGGTKSKLFTRRLQLLEGHLCQSLPQTSEQFIHTHTHIQIHTYTIIENSIASKLTITAQLFIRSLYHHAVWCNSVLLLVPHLTY